VKISVITTVLNRVETIGQSLESTLLQAGVQLELIVQDAGSVDGTIDVIKKYNDQRLFLEVAKDSGIYDGINRGIARASGDIIGLMHSDDTYASNLVLSKVVHAFFDESVDGVYGDLDYVSNNERSRIIRKWRSGSFSHNKLKSGWMPPHPTLFLRRHIYEKWGMYDTSFKISADYEAILRYLVLGNIKLCYLPETLVKMRMGGVSNQSLEHLARKTREDYIAIKRHGIGGLGTLALKNISKIGQFKR